jgi:hypothetical protein
LAGCADFQGLPPGETIFVLGAFADGGISMTVNKYQHSPPDWITTGFAQVVETGPLPGEGHQIRLAEACLAFDFGISPVSKVTLLYRHELGNVNITVNDDLFVVNEFRSLHDTDIGGVHFTVDPPSEQQGELTLEGDVLSLSLGAGILFVDQVCFA